MGYRVEGSRQMELQVRSVFVDTSHESSSFILGEGEISSFPHDSQWHRAGVDCTVLENTESFDSPLGLLW